VHAAKTEDRTDFVSWTKIPGFQFSLSSSSTKTTLLAVAFRYSAICLDSINWHISHAMVHCRPSSRFDASATHSALLTDSFSCLATSCSCSSPVKHIYGQCVGNCSLTHNFAVYYHCMATRWAINNDVMTMQLLQGKGSTGVVIFGRFSCSIILSMMTQILA